MSLKIIENHISIKELIVIGVKTLENHCIKEKISACFLDELVDVETSVTNESIDVKFSLKDDNLERNILVDDRMVRRIGKILQKHSSLSSTFSFSSYLNDDFSYQIKFISLPSSFSAINFSRYKYLVQLFHQHIDEEGQGYLSDLKSEWRKSILTQEQIERKELIFIFEHYWGRFVAWMRLPRSLSSIKTK
jgi:YesN/AraC family two-component response regulator